MQPASINVAYDGASLWAIYAYSGHAAVVEIPLISIESLTEKGMPNKG